MCYYCRIWLLLDGEYEQQDITIITGCNVRVIVMSLQLVLNTKAPACLRSIKSANNQQNTREELLAHFCLPILARILLKGAYRRAAFPACTEGGHGLEPPHPWRGSNPPLPPAKVGQTPDKNSLPSPIPLHILQTAPEAGLDCINPALLTCRNKQKLMKAVCFK